MNSEIQYRDPNSAAKVLCFLMVLGFLGILTITIAFIAKQTRPIGEIPHYSFNLSKVNGTCGLVIRGNFIAEVIPDGPAAIQGSDINRGDTIVNVNGVPVRNMSHSRIVSLIKEYPEYVFFELRENDEPFEEL
ncbi:hypothetical protein PRIPAC_92250 [Pristionchus pacificus]|uniref:PDZ domain-containing protein n=1 Tax=Pristionchus pacificus TaxID=54126 RepID=A0A454XMU0_PRIPA|nr:hypothetical protein PRIPAC_92250 [Pristionchus pacificus]|eukprot:PDM76224.1 PDZ domain-containing protein [Pristionchus pacificus]